MAEGEKLAALLRVQAFPEEDNKRFIVMGTRQPSTIKEEDGSHGVLQPALGWHHRDPRLTTTTRLIAVAETDGTHDLVIGTRNGMAIRFSEEDARPMGRTAGVRRSRHLSCVMATRSWRCRSSVRPTRCLRFARTWHGQAHGAGGIPPAVARRHRFLQNVQTSDRNGNVVGIASVTRGQQRGGCSWSPSRARSSA